MSPLKQLCWSAVGQAPWVQVGFKPQSWEERIHRLPWAEAPGSPDLRYLSGAKGAIVDPLFWSAQTVACSLGPCTISPLPRCSLQSARPEEGTH